MQAVPKPVLTLLDLSIALESSDLGAENLENEFIISNMNLSQIQRRIQETEALGQDTTSLEKSVKGAIKLVTAMKLPNLAERFNTILEERLLKEARETMLKEATEPTPKETTEPKTSVVDTNDTFILPEIRKAPELAKELEPVQLSSPSFVKKKTPEPVKELKSMQLTSPSFVKKKTIEEPPKVGKVLEPKETTKSENKGTVKKAVGELKAGTNPLQNLQPIKKEPPCLI